MESRNYTVICLSEAISPITHASGSSGNESIVMREEIPTSRGTIAVPVLSGNALRHRAIREPGWRWLIGQYELAGKLNLAQLNFGLHGGNLTEGGGRENTRRIADFQRIFPLGRLVGGTIPDQILAGSLHTWRGLLVCEENRQTLETILPGGLLPAKRLRAAESFISGWQYTRSDAAKTATDLRPTDLTTDSPSNLMIFSGQSVMRGSLFVHGFSLPHVSEFELGALLWSLQLWQAAGGTIGGQASRGHGRLKTAILTDDWDGDAAVNAYLGHARAAQDEAVAWLTEVFGAASSERTASRKKGVKA